MSDPSNLKPRLDRMTKPTGAGRPAGGSPAAGAGAGAAGNAGPAPATSNVPSPPASPLSVATSAVKSVTSAATTVANVASTIANPLGAATGKLAGLMDEGLAALTNPIAAMLPALPAATLLKMALGLPHLHPAHPPGLMIPPIALPSFGPIMLGTCVQVLINGMPAARCGDIGFGFTCCGIPPMYEILTGSSNVFIGGARAARSTIDITMHCKQGNPGGRSAQMAQKVSAKAQLIAKIMQAAATVANIAGKIAMVGGMAGQLMEAADVAEDDAAMSAALVMNTAMMAAQMAADAVAMAAAAFMGKDPTVPPTGTPGMILFGAPNVLIGGLPLPSSMRMAEGLMKKLKGLRFKGKPIIPGLLACPPCVANADSD